MGGGAGSTAVAGGSGDGLSGRGANAAGSSPAVVGLAGVPLLWAASMRRGGVTGEAAADVFAGISRSGALPVVSLASGCSVMVTGRVDSIAGTGFDGAAGRASAITGELGGTPCSAAVTDGWPLASRAAAALARGDWLLPSASAARTIVAARSCATSAFSDWTSWVQRTSSVALRRASAAFDLKASILASELTGTRRLPSGITGCGALQPARPSTDTRTVPPNQRRLISIMLLPCPRPERPGRPVGSLPSAARCAALSGARHSVTDRPTVLRRHRRSPERSATDP